MDTSKKKKTTQEDLRKNSASDHTLRTGDFDWQKHETILNKRMNIIGSNGNNGFHYWEDSWNDEYED